MTTHTIDITPAGLTTPEGQARVAEALRAKDDAGAAIIREASRLYRTYLRFLPDADVARDLEEETPTLGILLDEYDAAHERFMQALATPSET